MEHAVAAPRADRRKSTLLNIHKSPVDVVVVVAGAALLEPSIRDVATDVVPMIQLIPGSHVSSKSCLFFVVHKRTRSFRVRSVVLECQPFGACNPKNNHMAEYSPWHDQASR